ncbi:hypothetical protein FRB97_004785, partial [Tulasnella sp. 331]
MKLILTTPVAMPILSVAAPSAIVPRTLVYNPINAPAIFTDLTCILSKYLTAGEPLSFGYPGSSRLSTLIGPNLAAAIGSRAVEDLDSITDQLC